MKRLTWILAGILAGILRRAARLLPPGQRRWAEAVQAETGLVPAGWPRLRWLAGGVWLVVREAGMIRKIGYWVGLGAVAAAGAWAVWLSWRTVPAADSESMTDRVRVLVGAAALAALPWIDRRRGPFGPVGAGLMARLVRVTGCAAMCGVGMVLVTMDSHAGLHGVGSGAFRWPHEVAGLALIGALVAAPRAVRTWWPQVDSFALWSLITIVAILAWMLMPIQLLGVVYVAGILAATSRRSPVTPATLTVATAAGLAGGLALYGGITLIPEHIGLAGWLLVLIAIELLTAGTAGVAAAWLLPDNGDPKKLRPARVRQALIAGTAAGAIGGLLLTLLSGLVPVMLIGPVAGLVCGAIGGIVAVDHPRESRPSHSRDFGPDQSVTRVPQAPLPASVPGPRPVRLTQ